MLFSFKSFPKKKQTTIRYDDIIQPCKQNITQPARQNNLFFLKQNRQEQKYLYFSKCRTHHTVSILNLRDRNHMLRLDGYAADGYQRSIKIQKETSELS